MRSTRPKIVGRATLALAALCVLGVAPSPAVGDTTPRAKLQRAVDAVAAAGAAGVVALVREGGRTIRVVGGHGNLARRTPMRASDRFRVGSSTKSFVATVVLQLAGERKLALEDSVERWLPGLVPNGGQITVRQLLNHTSGLADYAPEEDETFIRRVLANRRKAWQPRELVALGTARGPLFAPGARWSYSNTGWILLGLIVEAASGNAARDGAGRADLHASAPARDQLRHPAAHRRAPRARVLAPRRAAPLRHQRPRPVVGVGGRGDRLDRGRSRALLPHPARRPPAAPRPAGGDEDDRRHPQRGPALRARPDHDPPSLRRLLGPRRRDARLPVVRGLARRPQSPADHRRQRGPEPPHAARATRARAPAGDRLLRLTPPPGQARPQGAPDARLGGPRRRPQAGCCGRPRASRAGTRWLGSRTRGYRFVRSGRLGRRR